MEDNFKNFGWLCAQQASLMIALEFTPWYMFSTRKSIKEQIKGIQYMIETILKR